MNLRFFLTSSACLLLVWMAVSYTRALPTDGYIAEKVSGEKRGKALLPVIDQDALIAKVD